MPIALTFLFLIIAAIIYSCFAYNSFRSFLLALIGIIIGGVIGFAIDKAVGGHGGWGIFIGAFLAFLGSIENKSLQEKTAKVLGRILAVILLMMIGGWTGAALAGKTGRGVGAILGILFALVGLLSEGKERS